MTNIFECEPKEVQSWLEQRSVILIDVREESELISGRVSGAINLPLSRFDPDKLPVHTGKRVAFLCAHGIRSRQVTEYVVLNGLLDNAFNVTGGVSAWLQDGLPLEKP